MPFRTMQRFPTLLASLALLVPAIGFAAEETPVSADPQLDSQPDTQFTRIVSNQFFKSEIMHALPTAPKQFAVSGNVCPQRTLNVHLFETKVKLF